MNRWLLAARPKTLSAAVVPVLVGTALAWRDRHSLEWAMFACALAGAIFIQIGTNFVNDALDFKKGTDTAERLGPLRVTQAGLLSADAVMRGAYLCFVAAALCGIPLMLRGGWPLLVIGVSSIAAAYAYTGGPYPLAYNGLGELFVLVFFGFVAVGGSYYVQTLSVRPEVFVAGLAVGLLAIVLLAINNLRDVVNDRVSNKRTLAVRFGETFARTEIALCAFAPFVCVVIIAAMRAQWHWLLVLFGLPPAATLVMRVMRSRGAELNGCLAMAGALQWAFGVTFVIGSLW